LSRFGGSKVWVLCNWGATPAGCLINRSFCRCGLHVWRQLPPHFGSTGFRFAGGLCLLFHQKVSPRRRVGHPQTHCPTLIRDVQTEECVLAAIFGPLTFYRQPFGVTVSPPWDPAFGPLNCPTALGTSPRAPSIFKPTPQLTKLLTLCTLDASFRRMVHRWVLVKLLPFKKAPGWTVKGPSAELSSGERQHIEACAF